MYDHGHDHPNVNEPPYPAYLNPYPYVPMHTPPLDEFGRCRGIWVYLRADLCGHNHNEQHAYEKLPFLAARAPCMHKCCQTPPPPSPKPMNHIPADQSIHTRNVTDCQKSHKEDMNNDSEPIVVRVYTKAKVDYSLTIRDRKVILAPSNPSDPLQQWIKDEKFGKNITDDQGFSSFALVNKATGQAIKHSIGVTYPVQLTDYNPEELDKSVLWTLGKRLKFRNLVGCGMAHKLFYGTGLKVITKNGPSLVTNICGVWNFYVKEPSTAMGGLTFVEGWIMDAVRDLTARAKQVQWSPFTTYPATSLKQSLRD
ncbi:ricin B-like lectin R40G3 [Tanacetum coccineum]